MYITPHDIIPVRGFIKSTNGSIIRGAWNDDIDISVVQLNHYKTKTWPEFVQIRKRGRADLIIDHEDVKLNFDRHNFNEVEDNSVKLKAFYKSS